MSDKAIIIKGPFADSKSYFTGLPKSFDELVQKATKLFPVPPNHTGQLVLGGDAILMPDVLPFLKEREVLTFRWTANTPRSSLRQPSRTAEELAKQANSSGGSNCSSTDSAIGGIRTSRGVRWDSSVNTSGESRPNEAVPSGHTAQQQTTVRPYRYSSTVRAEHSRRVLNEQERLRRSEQTDESVKRIAADDPFKATHRHESKPQSNSRLEPGSPQADAPNSDASTSNASVQSGAESNSSINSPSTSYTVPSSERERNQSDEEHQNSSPIASPTRNIRGAQKSNHNGWSTPLGSEKRVNMLPKKDAEEKSDAVESATAVTAPKASEKTDDSQKEVKVVEPDSNDQASKPASADQASSSRAEEIKLNTAYQRMGTVVDALRSHPSNQFFRQPLVVNGNESGPANGSTSLVQFLRQTGRPIVDFAVIASKLSKREYSQEDPFVGFASDLEKMWSNSRAFFGPASPQAHCAELLDRFSRILMVEWRRDGDVRSRVQDREAHQTTNASLDSKEQAMARAAKMLHNMAYGSGMPVNVSAQKRIGGEVKRSVVPLVKQKTQPQGGRADQRALTMLMQQQRSQVPILNESRKQLQSISPRSSKHHQFNGAQRDHKQNGIPFTPRTQAFLDTMFPNGQAANGQPATIGSEMTTKLQRQARGSITSGNGERDGRDGRRIGSSSPQKRENLKRAAEGPAAMTQRPIKKIHTEQPRNEKESGPVAPLGPAQNGVDVAMEVPATATLASTSTKGDAAPQLLETESAVPILANAAHGPSEWEQTHFTSVPAPTPGDSVLSTSGDEESAVEVATASVSGPSSAKRVRRRIESPANKAIEAIVQTHSPRRSPRRSIQTAKVQESKPSTPVERQEETAVQAAQQQPAQLPTRMVTRRSAAAAMGTPRRSRATAV